MDNKEIFYAEARFGGFTDIDGTLAFFNRVNSLLDLPFVVLDVGCGRGEYDGDSIPIRRNLRILRSCIALFARLITNKYHSKVISVVQDGRKEEEDMFPTVYQCNSIWKLKSAMKKCGTLLSFVFEDCLFLWCLAPEVRS